MQQYGINIKTAAKIYEFYGDQAYSIIKENPYRLIEDIKNIGFKTADQIAIKTGAFENSSFRIKAAITYSLEQAAANGHTYLPKSVLYRYIGTLIQDVNTSDVDSCLEKMSTDSKVIIRYNAPEKSVAGDDYDKGEEVLSPEAVSYTHLDVYKRQVQKSLFQVKKKQRSLQQNSVSLLS